MALLLKYSETGQYNRYAVTTANYVMAFCFSLVLSSGDAVAMTCYFPLPESFLYFMDEWRAVIGGGSILFSLGASFFWALIIGFAGGLFYCFGFIYIQKSIRENGVGITGAVAKLGIFFPMVLSLILWREVPTEFQIVGIVICVIAMGIISYPFDGSKRVKRVNLTLLLLFLISGSAEFSGKFFEKYAHVELKSVFLFTVFFTAFWISLIFLIKNVRSGGRLGKKDLLMGLLVGIPNLLTSWFLISAFKHYPASVAFPIFSSGSILLITLGGAILFKERPTPREWRGIGMIVIAILLMNG